MYIRIHIYKYIYIYMYTRVYVYMREIFKPTDRQECIIVYCITTNLT